MEILGDLKLEVQFLLLSALKCEGCFFNFLEEPGIVKDVGHDEVEKTPKFFEVIIEGGTGKEELESGLEIAQSLEVLRFCVLDLVGLINNEGLPVDPRQLVDALFDSLEGSHQNIKLPGLNYLF